MAQTHKPTHREVPGRSIDATADLADSGMTILIPGIPDDGLLAARATLDEFVRAEAYRVSTQVGFGWQASANAPNTYGALRDEFARSARLGTPLPVSSAHCDDTIFLTPSTNHAARFWHDSLHVDLSMSFTPDDEFSVAYAQLDQLARSGFGPRSLEYRLLHADTVGQTLCLTDTGEFPKDQLRFAKWCLEVGPSEAVAYEFASW